MGKLFGAYDIRGVYGQDFDDQFACRLGRALAKFISPNEPGRFLVGYDTRRSSPRLADFLTEGLCDSGQLVTVMGVASTPRIAWEGAQDDYDCSIAVTASHLSSAHNGFKISIRGAVSLSAETGLQELEALVEQAMVVLAQRCSATSSIGLLHSARDNSSVVEFDLRFRVALPDTCRRASLRR